VSEVVYLSVDDWVMIAGLVLGTSDTDVRQFADLNLADSALHAPQAGFGNTEFYPGLTQKAAVLGWHLANNHALPDGNKRTAFISMIEFLESNHALWRTPDTDDAYSVMLAVAAGNMDQDTFTTWVTSHTTLPPDERNLKGASERN
jgi:death on curing protein